MRCSPGSEPSTWGRRLNVAKEDRGFASMDRAKQREIASKGGKAAHQKGTAHEWTSEEARDAGRKGGIASHRRRREQQGDRSMDASGSGSERAVAMDREGSSRDTGSSGSWDRSDSSSSHGSERSMSSESTSEREE